MTLSATIANHPDDTIVAVSSAAGAGPRAIVRVSGPRARALIDALFTPDATPVARGRFLVPGALRLRGVHSPLPARLYFFAAPHTYTGQDLAEIHTVGSTPLVEQLVADLLDAGGRPARPGEFTLRAFLAGKKDLAQAEAVHAVIAAGTDDDLKLALIQLAGGVTQPLHALREDLLNLLADLEAALDFADEDIEFVGASETLARLGSAIGQLELLQQQLGARTISGRPVRVALVGLPNAGKTSLFNALAGGDALVSSVPGTTRDYLARMISLGGMDVELIDTAGWQDALDAIDRQAQDLGREQAAAADVIVWCVEAGDRFDPETAAKLNASGAKVLRVITKTDLLENSELETRNSGLSAQTSTITPGGIDPLRRALTSVATELSRSALAPSQSRCQHHVAAALAELTRSRGHVAAAEPPELAAASLRIAIDQLGELTGAVYTTDLLDRIFTRFCIGK